LSGVKGEDEKGFRLVLALLGRANEEKGGRAKVN